MFNNDKKTFAFLISGATGIFQRDICQYVQQYAKAKDYNMAIFSSFIGYETHKGYLKGEANIMNLPPFELFDGVIIVPDTFREGPMRDKVLKSLRERCRCPVVSIRSNIEDFYSVNTDNSIALEGLIKHLIEEHHMKKISYLGGTKGHPDAVDRLECYKRVMDEYKLPYDNSMIYHGNFWSNLGKEYFDYFLGGDKSTWPEAVVCANDYMAVALCDECSRRGVSVPGDVAITGFDNVNVSETCYPPITTSGMSVESLVDEAFRIIEKVNEGEEVPRLSLVPANIIIRNSCGCGEVSAKNLISSINSIKAEYENVYAGLYQNTYISVELESMNDYESIRDYMNILDKDGNTTKDMYICICEKEHKGNKYLEHVKSGYTETMKCVYAIKDRQLIDEMSFKTENLLPDNAFRREESIQCFFSALHFLENTFGYVAHSYIDNMCHSRTFHNWLVMVGNAMEDVRIKKQLNESVAILNELNIKESMTNLYNRRGFEQFSTDIFSRALKNHKAFVLMEMDMDGLKMINDTYGHAAGDVAIEAVAKIFKKVSINGEICSRVGGDEFWIIAYDYYEEDMEDYIERFYNELARVNKRLKLGYNLSVSCGGIVCSPGDGDTLDAYMNEVDTIMYENKKKNKAGRDAR